MTSFDSKVLPGSQKMRTHVTMVFAWSEPTDIFLYCAQSVACCLKTKLIVTGARMFG